MRKGTSVLLAVVAAGAILFGSALAASPVAKTADGYPSSTISIIVDSKAGTYTDLLARGFARVMEKYAGVKIIIENVEGGSGVMSANRLLSKKADGYTIYEQSSTLPITIATKQAPFEADDVYPLALLMEDYCVLTVKADGPYQTFDDIVQFAKANPGKFNLGAAKFKGSMHIFTLKFSKAADIQLNYIAYNNAEEAMLGVMGENIPAMASTINIVREDVKAGKLKILACTLAERPVDFPEVPTFRELGYDYVTGYSVWRALFLKPGIPQDRVEKLAEIVDLVCHDPEWKAYIEKPLYSKELYLKADEFASYYKNFHDDVAALTSDLK